MEIETLEYQWKQMISQQDRNHEPASECPADLVSALTNGIGDKTGTEDASELPLRRFQASKVISWTRNRFDGPVITDLG